MCMQIFTIIYSIQLENGVTSSQRLEGDFNLKPVNVTEDDRRNLPDLYRELFGVKCEHFLISLVENYMKELAKTPFNDTKDLIGALDLLQGVIMTARAQHEIIVHRDLYDFAQKYDRLDDEDIRLSLHEEARKKYKQV
ncbi:hypothetical protein [Oligoflexus tunisiensis]|uniref:hypothetical protein n=1 Tax=Oligoflexus tunisiensis TaxID=708132 RepID=UPI001C405166|nr:hypothetical protein [Oligoflexus tunisiensis]